VVAGLWDKMSQQAKAMCEECNWQLCAIINNIIRSSGLKLVMMDVELDI
jgi:hypothetical protein